VVKINDTKVFANGEGHFFDGHINLPAAQNQFAFFRCSAMQFQSSTKEAPHVYPGNA